MSTSNQIINSVKERKSELVSLGNALHQMKERSSDIKDRSPEMTQIEERDLRVKKRKERTLQELSDSIRKSNARITGLPEGEEREKGPESLSNIY